MPETEQKGPAQGWREEWQQKALLSQVSSGLPIDQHLTVQQRHQKLYDKAGGSAHTIQNQTMAMNMYLERHPAQYG